MQISGSWKAILLAAVIGVGLAACGGKAKTEAAGGGDDQAGSAAATATLYDRLGGKDAITAVVDDFIANVVADARINSFFANADVANLKAKLVDQICEASGGPCKYTGKTMKETHTGMGVKNEHFDAMVEDLVKSLDKFNVAEQDKADLLAALGGMRGDIVTP
ncbi:MAG: group 1 truncated hemoglobin [Kofleriaceae bacterium]